MRSTFAAAAALLVGLLLVPSPASAVEFRLDGYYRFRASLFDTLSLDREDETTEGARTFLSQRLRVTPHIRLSPNVHVYVDFDVFDAARFGGDPEILQAVGALQEGGDPFDEPLPLSGAVLPGTDYRESVFVRRAWVELYTPYVDLKVGRMGSHWGMGLLANDGDCWDCDYGDTVDRIMLSTSALDPVRLSLAFDTRAEGFVNRNDDTHSFLFTGGYLGEVHQAGGYVRWTRQPSNRFNLLHGDVFGRTKLGPLSMELEALILWGSADTTDIGIDDLKVLSGGGALRAGLEINPIDVGLEVGLATGDKEPSDNEWHTMRFDRDHDVALLMFEQTMPTFAVGEFADEDNGNIDASRALTGEGVSNAFYLRPRFHVDIRDDLRAGVAAVLAWPVVPEAFGTDKPKFYGAEIDLDAQWLLYGNFELGARAAFFFPGPVYDPYRSFTFGGEMRAIVHF